METEVMKIPTIKDLVSESEQSLKDNALMVLLNQPPPATWVKKNPNVMMEIEVEGNKKRVPAEYLPIERVEYLLSRIFTKWWVEVRSIQAIANSVVATVRLYVINPISGETQWQDGVGAAPIQTDKGAGAMDWNKAKAAGVQMAAPISETFAIKDAAEKFGKLFGKDLNRKDQISYDTLLKKPEPSPEEKRMTDLLKACKTISAVEKIQEAEGNNFDVSIFNNRKEELKNERK